VDADGFVQSICADPDNESQRLIYADWLEERGDPRGQFLRLELHIIKGLSVARAEYHLPHMRFHELAWSIDLAWLAKVNRVSLLVCRLRGDPSQPDDPLAGEVELGNGHRKRVAIAYSGSPHDHLELRVTRADGESLQRRKYKGGSTLPVGGRRRLAPGERFAFSVSLFGGVSEEVVTPGEYEVQAVFQWGHRSLSAPLRVAVTEENCKRLRLRRQADADFPSDVR
jgi:uncharacterized protein (TIGR02996 family)